MYAIAWRFEMPAKLKFWADPKWLTLLLSILLMGTGIVWRDGVRSKEIDTLKEAVARHDKGFEKLDKIANDVAWIRGKIGSGP